MCDQQGLRSACAYAQSGQSLCLPIKYSVTVGLLTGHRLGFLGLGGGGGGVGVGGCAGSSGSARVGRPHCWKSHATAHLLSHPFVHLCLRNFRSQDYLIE